MLLWTTLIKNHITLLLISAGTASWLKVISLIWDSKSEPMEIARGANEEQQENTAYEWFLVVKAFSWC